MSTSTINLRTRRAPEPARLRPRDERHFVRLKTDRFEREPSGSADRNLGGFPGRKTIVGQFLSAPRTNEWLKRGPRKSQRKEVTPFCDHQLKTTTSNERILNECAREDEENGRRDLGSGAFFWREREIVFKYGGVFLNLKITARLKNVQVVSAGLE